MLLFQNHLVVIKEVFGIDVTKKKQHIKYGVNEQGLTNIVCPMEQLFMDYTIKGFLVIVHEFIILFGNKLSAVVELQYKRGGYL